MKLIIIFNRGQYSPIKDEFKGLYTKSFKWKGDGWYGKTGSVVPTEKMEPGSPITFHVECADKLAKTIIDFCNSDLHKIAYDEVESFDVSESIPQMFPTDTVEPKITNEEPKIEEFPWMYFHYHYNLWEYRKEQLMSEWNPEFKVTWK